MCIFFTETLANTGLYAQHATRMNTMWLQCSDFELRRLYLRLQTFAVDLGFRMRWIFFFCRIRVSRNGFCSALACSGLLS